MATRRPDLIRGAGSAAPTPQPRPTTGRGRHPPTSTRWRTSRPTVRLKRPVPRIRHQRLGLGELRHQPAPARHRRALNWTDDLVEVTGTASSCADRVRREWWSPIRLRLDTDTDGANARRSGDRTDEGRPAPTDATKPRPPTATAGSTGRGGNPERSAEGQPPDQRGVSPLLRRTSWSRTPRTSR
jgi:hypothetical protein